MMFDQPGIGVDDLPWIYRDQFVHYVELTYALGDRGDWPSLRADLLRALTAAFGLHAGELNGARLTPGQCHALEILDKIRHQHDPATDWSAFCDLLWSRRHDIRPDLP